MASWGLPRQPPACLPAAKITDTHSHTYKEYAQRYSPSTRFMHRKEDSRQIAWGFLRELPGWVVSRKPQSQISVKLALDQAYSCLLRSKNKESATECYGIFANNLLKCNFKHNSIVISKNDIEGQLFLKIIICVYTQKEELGLVRYSYSQR